LRGPFASLARAAAGSRRKATSHGAACRGDRSANYRLFIPSAGEWYRSVQLGPTSDRSVTLAHLLEQYRGASYSSDKVFDPSTRGSTIVRRS